MQARLGEVLTKSFKDFYGNLEKVLVANLIWSLSLIPIVGVLMIKGFSSGLLLLPFFALTLFSFRVELDKDKCFPGIDSHLCRCLLEKINIQYRLNL